MPLAACTRSWDNQGTGQDDERDLRCGRSDGVALPQGSAPQLACFGMAHRHFNQAAAISEAALGGNLEVGAGADQKMTADLLAALQGRSSKGAAAIESIGQE